MTGGVAHLLNLNQQGVVVAIIEDFAYFLNVTGRFALVPQFFSRSRIKPGFSCLESLFQRFFIHIGTILNTPDEHEIDPTLLECNNLIDVIEVDRLEKSTVDEICKYLGQKNKFHNPRIIEVLKNKKTKDKSMEMGF
jgi:hypothetical protein